MDPISSLFGKASSHEGSLSIITATAIIFAISSCYLLSKGSAHFSYRLYPSIPLIETDASTTSTSAAKARWVTSASEIISSGLKTRKPFQVLATVRPMIILPARYIDEIKNHANLDFAKAVESNFYGKYPGFDGLNSLNQNEVFQDAIRVKLTQGLNRLVTPLAQEAEVTVLETFSESTDWTPCTFGHHAAPMIARLSALAFLGPKFCRNQHWIDVSVNYTLDVFNAARVLNLWSPILRRVVVWFLPETRKLRAHLRKARGIIEPEMADRAEQRKQNAGLDTNNDALEWFRESSEVTKKPLDITLAQICLSVAAIHITSQLLINVMYDLAAYPKYIDRLREELSQVLLEDQGWKSTTPAKLKRMDSVIKESQRMNPSSMISMHRYVEKPTKLSDNTLLPKGAWVTIAATPAKDANIWTEPDTFDGLRFYNLRQQAGNESRYQLTTTSSEQIGFGVGRHACPGRFFASHELKFLLAQLIVKFDWKLSDSEQGRPKSLEIGTEMMPNRNVVLLRKSRQI
ncbi:hypothetical protein UA08_01139 [Talaromyces atroroseus]|uniref:Cytochrome P450 n=1 Tax=Talaromyces atroroseus TaxID=1441469 RepID=A0A1Q5Q9X4_TALAT|nr:hypothetical protein UA08_01139 [Talaromyces atroroseus]OKL62743.1 hypothetical protein UA08_01139 [Talaromyces atroroseus]